MQNFVHSRCVTGMLGRVELLIERSGSAAENSWRRDNAVGVVEKLRDGVLFAVLSLESAEILGWTLAKIRPPNA